MQTTSSFSSSAENGLIRPFVWSFSPHWAWACWLDPLATANLLCSRAWGFCSCGGPISSRRFIVFFFLAGLLAVRILRQAKAWHFAALGVAGGLAFLAKPSFEPFLLAFAAAFAFGWDLPYSAIARIGPAHKQSAAGRGLGVDGADGSAAGPLQQRGVWESVLRLSKFWMWMDDFRPAYPFAATNWSRGHLEKPARGSALRRMVFPAPYPAGCRHAVVERHARSGARFFIPSRSLSGTRFSGVPAQRDGVSRSLIAESTFLRLRHCAQCYSGRAPSGPVPTS